MPEELDFLSVTTDSIRHSIEDIDDSYNNFWDLFAELSQNAVDAITVSGRKGAISIKVNCQKRDVVFRDNGCGISADSLPGLLNIFSSGKSRDAETIGEKGVGLKFVLFQSSRFVITSSDGSSSSTATVVDANTWKKQSSDNPIPLLFERQNAGKEPGTTVEVYGVEKSEDEDPFTLNVDQFVLMLRTKTALGNTKAIWDSTIESIDISLEYTDINGRVSHRKVANRYWLPTEGVDGNSVVSLEEFAEWSTADKDDSQKRNRLKDKILVDSKSDLSHNGRLLRYWACFLPSRGAWEDLNISAGVCTKEEYDAPAFSQTWSQLLLQGMITASTKGMPTAITVAAPPVGNAGYLPDFFIIFEDNSIRFDIGRKSFRGKTSSIYKLEAKQVFNTFARLAKYSAGQLPPQESDFNREDLYSALSSMKNLDSSKVAFQKLPGDQEAVVSAIFFELVGSGVIDDLSPIYMGYRNKYDLYVKYQGHTKIVEFKSHIRNLIKDFSDYRKIFDEMDYVVCWDVNDEDVAKLKSEGIDLEPYRSSTFGNNQIPQCVSHQMFISNVSPIYVIDLKKLV